MTRLKALYIPSEHDPTHRDDEAEAFAKYCGGALVGTGFDCRSGQRDVAFDFANEWDAMRAEDLLVAAGFNVWMHHIPQEDK